MTYSQGSRREDKRLQAALVDLLFRQSRAVMLANLIIPWPVAYVLRHVVPGGQLLAWVALIYGLTGARLYLSHLYFSRGGEGRTPLAWARLFTLLSVLSSLLWGGVGWIGFVPAEQHLIAFSCIVIVGMAGGAVPSLSAYPPAYAGLLIAMNLPFALRCLGEDGPIYSIYLVFQICLVGVYFYYSRITYRSLRETIALRFENVALVAGLERERDRATAADRAKTRFLAAASHDLRQPIHALGLFTATLNALAQKGDVRAEEARSLAGKMRSGIGALGGLLHGLIDVSRLDAGLVPVEVRALPLRPLFAGLREEYAGQARERGSDLRVVDSSAWVESDPVQLKRILDNFLSNALRYAPEGRVVVGVRRRGEAAEIVVADDGPGIAPDQQGLVFEEFTQLDNPQRNRQQGLGLGLAIVRRLAALLDHPIGLHSSPGRGSAFSIRAPRILVPPIEADRPLAGLEEEDAGFGIMVLDDDAGVLDGLIALLTAWGYRVHAGTTVEELCRGHDARGVHPAPVDLIIADYRLAGGVTGSEAIERLIAHLGYSVPALIVTGDTTPQRMRDLAASGHEVLHKPLAPDLLQAAIRRAIEGPAASEK
ncbi:ATP-binding protein [Labrys neptuniae]